MGWWGLPATSGSTPVAATIEATMAPPPGMGPSGVGIGGVGVGGHESSTGSDRGGGSGHAVVVERAVEAHHHGIGGCLLDDVDASGHERLHHAFPCARQRPRAGLEEAGGGLRRGDHRSCAGDAGGVELSLDVLDGGAGVVGDEHDVLARRPEKSDGLGGAGNRLPGQPDDAI